MRYVALFSAFYMVIVISAVAGDIVPGPAACEEVQTCGSADCCARCGAHGCCEKYCKVVCEMKEVKKTVWTVKCEEFCPCLPSCPLHCKQCDESCGTETHCEASCEGCDKCCNPCAALEQRKYLPPTCGKMRVKKTLEKKEVTCKVPSYKCVVVYACANCGPQCDADKTEPQAPMPPTPAAPLPKDKTTQAVPLPPVDSARL
jgi:hypothetical protein